MLENIHGELPQDENDFTPLDIAAKYGLDAFKLIFQHVKEINSSVHQEGHTKKCKFLVEMVFKLTQFMEILHFISQLKLGNWKFLIR